MEKPIILCDLDETILDINYQLNVAPEEFQTAVAKTQEGGILIGLNSDSSIETLTKYARQWGMRGPIIAERGAVVSPEQGIPFFTLGEFGDEFPRLRDSFLHALMERQRATRYLVLLGDVNGLANTLPKLPYQATEARILVLVNGFRERSLSFYIRRHTPHGWQKNPSATTEIFTILQEAASSIGLSWEESDVDLNPDYGICIIHHKETQKSRAIGPLLAVLGERPVYMIGNSISDDLNDPRVIQCAVGNAKEEYKTICQNRNGLVAQFALTTGVMELFDRIVRS